MATTTIKQEKTTIAWGNVADNLSPLMSFRKPSNEKDVRLLVGGGILEDPDNYCFYEEGSGADVTAKATGNDETMFYQPSIKHKLKLS